MRNNAGLAEKVVSVTPAPVGRPRLWSENMQARFPEGTFARMTAALKDGEDRTDLVREAVERELKRRGK